MIRTHLGRSRVRESRMLGSVGAKLNGLATHHPPHVRRDHLDDVCQWCRRSNAICLGHDRDKYQPAADQRYMPYGEFFHGLIDEVRIYTRALSTDEIQVDMTTPLP